jgi:hypothetical protein
MKTFGRIAYEEWVTNFQYQQPYEPYPVWTTLTNFEKGAWETIAAAIIAVSDERRDDEK